MSGLDAIASDARLELASPVAAISADPRVEVPPPITDQEKQEEEAKSWSRVPYLFGKIVSPMLPELREVYSEAACLEWGREMVPVARKHKWNLGGADIYIGLGGATWALVTPTLAAVKRKRDENAARGKSDARAPAEETKAEAGAPPQARFHPDGSPVDGAVIEQ